jgi:E3 ubiquitin-protein ligase RAD18
VSENISLLCQPLTGCDDAGDTANCPVCSTRMKIDLIDAHLNTCLNVFPAQTSANPNAMAHRNIGQRSNISVQPKPYKPERLPRLSYSILKETALRKKLQELGIPSTGNRQMLERRHIEWVTLWNANCDASRPRKKPDLLRDLDTWERTQGMKASSLSGGADAGSQILNKDFDSAGWATTHDKSFQELIANARRSIRKDSKKSESSGEAPPVEGAEGDHPDEKRELPTPEESLRTEPDGDGWVDKYAPLGSRDPPDDHDPGNGDHDTFASDAMLLTSPAQSGGAENFHKYTNE